MSTTQLTATLPQAAAGLQWLWLRALAGRQWLADVSGTASTPQQGATREAARQVAAVRALADHYRRSDPGFASDLYAAADRHEGAVKA
jgi:hypothetical protein